MIFEIEGRQTPIKVVRFSISIDHEGDLVISANGFAFAFVDKDCGKLKLMLLSAEKRNELNGLLSLQDGRIVVENA